MNLEKRTILSQPSWVLQSETVEVCLTQLGGMMAPATFYRNGRNPIQPYYISPWQDEDLLPGDPVLVPLRGDFFCMPFGADNAYRGESYEVHGEPATESWEAVAYDKSDGLVGFEARMQTTGRSGTVTKRLFLRDDENVVYTQHELAGYSGKMTLGHHATLEPAGDEGGMLIATSPFQLGITRANPPYYNQEGEYAALADAVTFGKLSKVPTVWKGEPYTDCSRFPARQGYCDILAVYAKQPVSSKATKSRTRASTGSIKPTWTAATFPKRGYLWFALKDARTLPATVFWMENCGRHAAPWSGRNCCIGLEDVCGYLAEGLTPSAKKNPVSEQGIPTTVSLSSRKPYKVNYIQGVVTVPRGFDRVKQAAFSKGEVRFVSESGKTAVAAVRWSFLFDGDLR